MLPRNLVLAACATLLPMAAGAQEPPLTFGAETRLVSITAVIHDGGGRPVKGLTAKDVVVREDGRPQELSYFREVDGEGERIPLSIALVLDTSGSMNRTLPFLQEAAITLVRQMEKGDQGLVVSFNDAVRSSVEFTEDLDRLESFIDGLQAWGGTALNDAIHYALNRMRDAPGRKAVVVFSDGADRDSTLGEQDVVDYARAVEATVYTIGIKGSGPEGTPRGFLRKVAEETGGLHFFPGKVGEVLEVFRAIAAELQTHYAFAYSPSKAPDGTYRELQVELVPPRDGVKIRVRKGYFAVDRTRG